MSLAKRDPVSGRRLYCRPIVSGGLRSGGGGREALRTLGTELPHLCGRVSGWVLTANTKAGLVAKTVPKEKGIAGEKKETGSLDRAGAGPKPLELADDVAGDMGLGCSQPDRVG